MQTIEAVYENGVLRPLRPLDLRQNQRVRVTIRPADAPTAEHEYAGRIRLDPRAARHVVEHVSLFGGSRRLRHPPARTRLFIDAKTVTHHAKPNPRSL